MVLTTPRKCVRIDCTEVSPNYTETPVEEFEVEMFCMLSLIKKRKNLITFPATYVLTLS